ncbi:hypothetical protein FB45DRAFT_895739 [Roridomyces roridus]|uniref:Uncharacterized protein n=1 Tax=Roridomyces roridus TaxID=1738132 RepID=A0AAD7CA76_9AGAR|nr:hypothetical protein FB45DRAFT_895739 [Roridomyces roridus]
MKFSTILCLVVASLSVSALPVAESDLAVRAKIGKPVAAKPVTKPVAAKPVAAKPVAAKPVAAKPVAAPVAAKPATVAKPQASVCNGITSCLACTKNTACAFNSNTLKCAARTTTAAPFVTNSQLCPPLKQAQQIAPTESIAQQAKDKFAAMSNHIFVGEKDPTSGRHTFSAWTAANKDAGRCDSESKLCVFRLNNAIPKTVFDDRTGGFTKSDVQQMCTTAITLNLQSSAGGAVRDAAFVVQTKFGKPVCVQHQVAGQGSCFPLGIHATTSKLNSKCASSGNQPVVGKTTEIAAR